MVTIPPASGEPAAHRRRSPGPCWSAACGCRRRRASARNSPAGRPSGRRSAWRSPGARARCTPRLRIGRIERDVLRVAASFEMSPSGKRLSISARVDADEPAVLVHRAEPHEAAGIADQEGGVAPSSMSMPEKPPNTLVGGAERRGRRGTRAGRPAGPRRRSRSSRSGGRSGRAARAARRRAASRRRGRPGARQLASRRAPPSRPSSLRRCAGFSSNSSASFSIITPASSSASTMVTARRVIARHVMADADGDQLDRRALLDLLDHVAEMPLQIVAAVDRERRVVDRRAVGDHHQDRRCSGRPSSRRCAQSSASPSMFSFKQPLAHHQRKVAPHPPPGRIGGLVDDVAEVVQAARMRRLAGPAAIPRATARPSRRAS